MNRRYAAVSAIMIRVPFALGRQCSNARSTPVLFQHMPRNSAAQIVARDTAFRGRCSIPERSPRTPPGGEPQAREISLRSGVNGVGG